MYQPAGFGESCSLSKGSPSSPAIWGTCIAPACKGSGGTHRPSLFRSELLLVSVSRTLSVRGDCAPESAWRHLASQDADARAFNRSSFQLLACNTISAPATEFSCVWFVFFVFFCFFFGVDGKRIFLGKINTFDFYVIKSIHNIFPRKKKVFLISILKKIF